MAWLQFLNPMNWIKLLSLVKSLWDGIAAVYKTVSNYFIKKEQQSVVDRGNEAVRELDEANKIEDENERLRKKAEAACKLEKTLDPNADC